MFLREKISYSKIEVDNKSTSNDGSKFLDENG